MKRLFLITLLFVCVSVPAQEFKPFPRAHITPEQWESYYQRVRGLAAWCR